MSSLLYAGMEQLHVSGTRSMIISTSLPNTPVQNYISIEKTSSTLSGYSPSPTMMTSYNHSVPVWSAIGKFLNVVHVLCLQLVILCSLSFVAVTALMLIIVLGGIVTIVFVKRRSKLTKTKIIEFFTWYMCLSCYFSIDNCTDMSCTCTLFP